MSAAAAALRAEVADGDRDQRIHARRQIEREPEDENREQRERESPLGERAADVAREEARVFGSGTQRRERGRGCGGAWGRGGDGGSDGEFDVRIFRREAHLVVA